MKQTDFINTVIDLASVGVLTLKPTGNDRQLYANVLCEEKNADKLFKVYKKHNLELSGKSGEMYYFVIDVE